VRAILHGYQEYCVGYIKQHPYCALLLDMGLGKTLVTLTAVSDMLITGDITGRVLVVAPLPVARSVWAAEIDKWDHLKRLTCSLVLGTAAERTDALRRKAHIYAVNRENVPWLVETLGRRWPFGTVIVDELSSFKSPQAKRFKALRAVRPFVERLIGLTGTPAPNGLTDLWSQIYLLDQGERLERYVTRYRQKYFYPARQNGNVVYTWGLRDGAEEAIHRRIGDIVVSMRAKDHLQLPPRTDSVCRVELDDEDMRAYKRLERKAVADIAGDAITAANAAVLTGKLLQLASGAAYGEDGAAVELHSAKIDALKGLVEDAQGEPLIVFYGYRHERARLKEALPQAVVFDAKAGHVEAWNRGEIPVLLLHPASAGHGLNLQQGGHIAVWYSLTWSLELYQQANARIDRQGQERPVIIQRIVADGTVDETVLSVLESKASLQDALIKALAL
jgi:SNF2 family DNA or RNA helicase